MTTNTTTYLRELKLHSPAGVEPAVFTWPSIERQVNRTKRKTVQIRLFSRFQSSKKDVVFIGGDEIVKTIRLVFEGKLKRKKCCSTILFLLRRFFSRLSGIVSTKFRFSSL